MSTAHKSLSDELRGAVDLLIGAAGEQTNGAPPRVRQVQAGVSQVIKGQIGLVIKSKKSVSIADVGGITVGVPAKRK